MTRREYVQSVDRSGCACEKSSQPCRYHEGVEDGMEVVKGWLQAMLDDPNASDTMSGTLFYYSYEIRAMLGDDRRES